MNITPKIVQSYFNKYSVNTWKLESNLQTKIDNAVVVPVICENENLRTLLSSLLQNDSKYFHNTIFIFVINNFSDSSEEVKSDNQKSLSFLREIMSCNNSSGLFTEEIIRAKMNIGLIDAASENFEMPAKTGGVGLARKIGMDEALKIFDYESPAKKILICLDADCTVSANYLTAIVDEYNTRNLSAAYVKFIHKVEENTPTTQAIICYEIFLHYYVHGLKYADSPFAFHTIGSTMICDYESYIKAEGMNKRKAAEDFYFMEKLAKNYKVDKINSATVYPSSRSSWRVPFGTGQRVGRYLSHIQNEYLLYDPKSFDVLKQWLQIYNSSLSFTADEFIKSAENIHPELCNFLLQQNFVNDWTKILEHSTTPGQITKQKHKWFDGFRTLKLIHHLRDTAFPQLNMFEALNGMFERFAITRNFFWFEKEVPNLDVQIKYLELLRELT